MATNPKDPLLKTGPERQAELFKTFCNSADGYSAEDVINAAAMVLINALRQTHPRRENAAPRFDEISAKAKGILMDQYNSAGRLKGIYPYDQHIVMPLHINSQKYN